MAHLPALKMSSNQLLGAEASHVHGDLQCGTITLQQPMGVGTNKWGTGAKFSQENIGEALAASLSAGVTLLNTAQMYNTSEACIGNLRKSVPNGERAVIVSKFASLSKKPADLIPTLRKTLADLGVEAIDAFLVHHPKGDLKELAERLADAHQQGLARNVGVSNFGEAQLREFHGRLAARGVPLIFNEIEFSLLERSAESSGLLRTCKELGVTVLAWAPLASGRLTEKESVGNISHEPTVAALQEVKAIAKARSKTVAQVAINWCICKDTVPIPGARTRAQALDNAGALGWSLTEQEVARLDAVAIEGNGMYDNPDAFVVFLGEPRVCKSCYRCIVGCILGCVKKCVPSLSPH